MFWFTAPFLVATLMLLPLLARPPEAIGWIAIETVEILAAIVLFGLYNPDRFWWCWRGVRAVVFAGYLAYLVSTVIAAQMSHAKARAHQWHNFLEEGNEQ